LTNESDYDSGNRMAARYSQSRALRIIGQELKRRGIDLFELRCLRKEYYLQCGDPNPPYVGLLEITFSDDEMASLEIAAASGRGNDLTFVDFEALPEVLRAIGRYVENKAGTLLRISSSVSSSDQETMRLEYDGRDGRIHVEQLAITTLAETATRMYKERSRASAAAGTSSGRH
jgi:hypothetical protein